MTISPGYPPLPSSSRLFQIPSIRVQKCASHLPSKATQRFVFSTSSGREVSLLFEDVLSPGQTIRIPFDGEDSPPECIFSGFGKVRTVKHSVLFWPDNMRPISRVLAVLLGLVSSSCEKQEPAPNAVDPLEEVRNATLLTPSSFVVLSAESTNTVFSWKDESVGETGFVIEMNIDGGPYAPVLMRPSGADSAHFSATLSREHRYAFRGQSCPESTCESGKRCHRALLR